MSAVFAGFAALLITWLLPWVAHAPKSAFGPEHEQPANLEVLFVGDMMFDRSVREAMEREGLDHVFSCIADDLKAADIVVGNLEGPITDEPSKSVGSAVGSPQNFTFTFHPDIANLLKRHNFEVVSIANNHSRDFGRDGVRSTISYLREAGVGYFGDAISHETHSIRPQGIPLTFVAYNQFGGDAEITKEQVRAARARGELPIVFPHWGDEYVPANSTQKKRAREFIDAGAEIVIGAHPHVIQESEMYEGKYIYYSLGNFIFDQYWNDEVRTGLMVTVTFSKDGVIGVSEKKSYLERDRRTCVKNDA